MSLSAVLRADFWELAAPLYVSHSEMPQLFELLDDAARLAVESLLGWTATLDGYPLTFTSIQASAVIIAHPRSSLRVPFNVRPVFNASGVVTFYAAQPDAFTRFAGDIAAALHVAQDDLQHDHDLNGTLVPGITGVAEWSTINQAIGVLVERGETIAGAHKTLQRIAAIGGLDPYQAAQNLLSNP